jgi:hypothetical protein
LRDRAGVTRTMGLLLALALPPAPDAGIAPLLPNCSSA